MPATYKLVYFNVRGRAEISRLLFAQAGVDYEDSRITGEEFAAMKADPTKLPLGQLPVLCVDDRRPIPQSHVIERHLARTFGMYGTSEEETVKIDVVCETLQDLVSPLFKMHFEKDEAKKAELAKEYVEKTSVPILTAMTKGLQANGEGKGFFIGSTMTLADVGAFAVLEGLMKNFATFPTTYPVLKEFVDRMTAEPKIAAWLEKRPVTDI